MYKVYKKTKTNVWLKGEIAGDIMRLKLIKSHSELGNFYVFNNILTMPYQRKIMHDLIKMYNILGIDKDTLIKENNEMLSLLENREPGFEMKIYSKISEINKIAKSFWDYQKSAMLTTALIIIPEDDLDLIGIFEQDQAEKRLEEWSKDSELLGFFLSIAEMKCNNLINKLDMSFPRSSLEESLPKEYLPFISNESWWQKIIGRTTNLLKQ